jgi:hypothetical protein
MGFFSECTSPYLANLLSREKSNVSLGEKPIFLPKLVLVKQVQRVFIFLF